MSSHETIYPFIPITGLGAWSAVGSTVQSTRQFLFSNENLEPDLLDPSESRFWKLNLKKYLDLHPQKNLDYSNLFPPNLLALACTKEALSMAHISTHELQSARVGICIGSTVGCTNYNDEFSEALYKEEKPDVKTLDDFFKTNTAQFLSCHFETKGPIALLSNACTSGLDAIGTAAQWLQSDLCDIVICGGVETIIPRLYQGFHSLLLTSPTQECRPFDRNRNGFVLSEACGILVLEKKTTRRKALSYYLGYGSASDAHNPTAPHPKALGLDRAIRQCLRDSSLTLDKIDLVHSHGVGSSASDLAEGRWLKKNIRHEKIIALKGFTGHSVGASGALSAVLTSLCLQEQMQPATKNFYEIDPEIQLQLSNHTVSHNKISQLKSSLTLSLGFGGSNACLAMGGPDYVGT